MSLDQKHGAAHAGCTDVLGGRQQTRNKRGFGRFEVAAEGAAAATMPAGGGGDGGIEDFGDEQRRQEDTKTRRRTLCWQNTEELASIVEIQSQRKKQKSQQDARKSNGYEDRVGRHLEDLKTAFEVLWGVWAGGGSKDVSNTADQITTWHIIA
ncbi:hypothetical protein B0H14DRAFT_2557316 [Mycena olivaceomarginata]|nr:hypothetical protein B0H14DRAFT_2557316 [Mycena olivaceomarginata]